MDVRVTWTFVSDEEIMGLTYPLNRWQLSRMSGREKEEILGAPVSRDSIVPLSSSVLAPGLSLPVA